MSLLFRRRDRDGKVHHYFVPFDPMVVIVVVTVLMAFAFSAWVGFRSIVYDLPLVVVSSISVALLSGFTLFAIAKLSVIRSGTLVSFGSAQMTTTMRRCYVFGYALMACVCLVAGLLSMAI